MPKPYTFPTIYDDLKTISITDLKKWDYFCGHRSGVISWSRNGQKTASVGIVANTIFDEPYFELSYNYRDKPIKYKVPLVKVPSNLGKGYRWYFRCPVTQKLCMKLYECGAYFLHRKAIKGGMYYKQTYSKNNRVLFGMYDAVFSIENIEQDLHKPNAKSFYAGKPTRKLRRIKKLNAVYFGDTGSSSFLMRQEFPVG